jgi:pimeloyl-ACP methyl ester carboxylesterase
MNVIVKGHSVHYTRTGNGPIVVLLHGWGDSHKTFSGLESSLKQKYQVIAVDLLGFGASEPPKETYTLEKYAQFVADFLRKIGEESVFAFIGHSNGGAIAIRGLSSGILHSDKLVLLAS